MSAFQKVLKEGGQRSKYFLPSGAPGRDITDYPYRADPTGSADSTDAINEAVAEGGLTTMPGGVFTISDTLLIGTPGILQGAGGATVIRPSASFPAGHDIIRLHRPDFTTTPYYWGVRDFQIRPAVDGVGRHAIEIDNSVTQLEHPIISNIGVGELNAFNPLAGVGVGGYALHYTGPFSLQTALIEYCRFRYAALGSIHLDGAGDSIWISHTQLSGPGRGIYFAPVGGAMRQIFRDINCTNLGGFGHFKNAQFLNVHDLHYEMLGPWVGDAEHSAVIFEDCSDCKLIIPSINPHLGSSDGAHCVYFKGTTARCLLDEPRLIEKASGGWVGMKFDSGALSNGISKQGRYTDATGAVLEEPTVSLDVGSTVGVWHGPLTIGNGWTASASAVRQGIWYRKDGRKVTVFVEITGGTRTAGTVIANAQIPVGCRPTVTERREIMSTDGASWGPGSISINTSGSIFITAGAPDLPYNTAVWGTFEYMAA